MSSNTKPVLIVGAGISGLSLAYWLSCMRIPCQIFEKSDRAGGLLGTLPSPFGPIEMAANGFMPNDDIMEMCEDLQVPLARRKRERRRRYVYREKPRMWPLQFKETIKFGLKLSKYSLSGFKALEPIESESIREWCLRHFDESVLTWLLAPALQGVYAGRVDHLSASMVLGRFFAANPNSNQTGYKGTLAPEKGMGQLIEALTKRLDEKHVDIQFGTEIRGVSLKDHSAIVFATPVDGWSSIAIDGKVLNPNFKCETLPLISATVFFEPTSKDLKGFGCLFPKSQGFYSLGALFNSSIFDNRSLKRSETWIFGGATNKEVLRFSDEEILRQVETDRKRLMSLDGESRILHHHIQRWPKALPHVNVELEEKLKSIHLPEGVYLTGNYLGRIGLSQMIAQNRDLAKRIQEYTHA